MRVLLVEDDSPTAVSMGLMLTSEGFSVFVIEDGNEALAIGRSFECEIILLDLVLPGMNGLDILREWRREGVTTPVMIVSGRANIEDKVKGLNLGADDYMTKPFHKNELVARIHAIVRRSKGHSKSTIEVGRLTIDPKVKRAFVDGKPLPLTRGEYRLLEVLALNLGQTMSKDALLEHMYGGEDEPDPKIIDKFVSFLRKKIRLATGSEHYIETVRGEGYLLPKQ